MRAIRCAAVLLGMLVEISADARTVDDCVTDLDLAPLDIASQLLENSEAEATPDSVIPRRPKCVAEGTILHTPYPTQLLGRDGQTVTYVVKNGRRIFEGDIILGPESFRPPPLSIPLHLPPLVLPKPKVQSGFFSSQKVLSFGVVGKASQWPDRTVPFCIDASFLAQGVNHPAGKMPTLIRKAIAVWSKSVGSDLTWWERKWTGQLYCPTYKLGDSLVRFTYAKIQGHCASEVGRAFKREQSIELSADCELGNILHEMAHAVGILHEHTRFDRGKFIVVHNERIQSGKKSNFDQPHCGDAFQYTEYDIGSIMHYPLDAFGSDSNETIELLPDTKKKVTAEGIVVGQREKFTFRDIYGIQKMYAAPETSAPATKDCKTTASFDFLYPSNPQED